MHLTTLGISVIPLLKIKARAIVNDGTGLKTRTLIGQELLSRGISGITTSFSTVIP